MPSLRDAANQNDPNRMMAIFSRMGGFGEFMNRVLFGVSRGGAAVATANAATQGGTYVQADVQSIATLANALKTAVNNLIAATGTTTESALTPTTNVVTLANVPKFLIDVNVATVSSGSATGSKKIRLGAISGPGALTPAAGEVIWDGGKKLKFAASDLVATVNAAYTLATDATVACMQQDVDQ